MKPIKLKLLRRCDDRVTYSLPSLKLLDEKFVEGTEWPADKPILAYRFNVRKAPKGVPIRDMVSKRKYICRTTYVGDKRNIPAPGSDGGAYGLKLASFGSRAEYRRVFLRTHTDDFVKPFREYQQGGYKKEDRAFMREHFPTTKGISVKQGGKPVGMLSVMHMPKNGRPYYPMSWICWVWVDGKLPKEERKAVHGMLGSWLKKLPGGHYGGAIHAVNLKSQNWFIKMGARPVQVFFIRR